MVGIRGNILLASTLILATASSAQAWWGYRASYGPWYYSPVYYVYPAYPVCDVTPPAAPKATPVPAPASKSPPAKSAASTAPTAKEPPALAEPFKKGPIVTESRSLGGHGQASVSGERCKVGFWNLTGRDVTLIIAGQQRTLLKDRAVTLDLGRNFSWQLDQRDAVTERVPEGEAFHEVILRQ